MLLSLNRISAQKLKIIAPANTSKGNFISNDLSNIIGINKIAPAGGKYIFILSIAKNKIIQASIVQTKSGNPHNSFNNNLNKHPTKEANVINPMMYKGFNLAGLLGFESSVNITISGGARKYI